jgi:hypothetical protein
MAKSPPQLGTKYACYKCGTKFYDLGRAQALCPKCSANPKDAPPEDPKKARERAAPVEIETDEVEVDVPADDEDEIAPRTVDEDDLLGADEDDDADEEEEE